MTENGIFLLSVCRYLSNVCRLFMYLQTERTIDSLISFYWLGFSLFDSFFMAKKQERINFFRNLFHLLLPTRMYSRPYTHFFVRKRRISINIDKIKINLKPLKFTRLFCGQKKFFTSIFVSFPLHIKKMESYSMFNII